MGASLQVELNKAQYYPGETVLIDINVHLPAINSAQITVEITELATVIYSETFDLDARNANGKLRTTWKIPGNVSFAGFGIDVRAFDGPLLLAETSSAFDVVLHWAQAPRYGFVASFEPPKHRTPSSTEYAMLMAAAMLASLPIILLFFFAQEHFIRGVNLEGTKG